MTTAAKVLLIASAGAAAAATAAILMARKFPMEGLDDPEPLPREHEKLKPISDKTTDGRRMRIYDTKTIKDKVGLLQDRIHASVKDPSMRRLALQVTRHCPSRDELCEAAAIHDWVKNNVRYTGDAAPHKLGKNGPVESVDIFQSAQATVDFGGDDCDGHVTLNATLAILNGIPARIRVTSPYTRGDDNYTHVYSVFGLGTKNNPSKWIASDTTLPGETKFGDEWPFKRKIDAVA